MDVDAYMAERVPRIDAAIEARLSAIGGPSASAIPDRLRGAMAHLLFPGGKRLRPVFAMAAAEAVGAPGERTLDLAVAVEFVHTYSLVHDDLPCMDDDDLRRGRPTVHKAFDEATAVLAGDALLTEAFAVLAGEAGGRGRDANSAAARLQVVARLAQASGAAGLVGGQMDDLAFEASRDSDRSDPSSSFPAAASSVSNAAARSISSDDGTRYAWLASIHARKTAALFQAAVVGGAVLAGAGEEQQARLDVFARDVGIAFQIADDLLDADSEEAASILRLQGIEDARDGAEGLLDRALLEIESWGEAAEPLRELARFAVRRKR